jgi:hypothetical protein
MLDARGSEKKNSPRHWDLPMREVLQFWDEIDQGGTDLAGIRALSLTDRFYLLVKVMNRVDLLHPWLYARCREVERAPDGFLDLWAREHGKSSIITIGGGIQAILQDPNVTVGIFSHTKPIAKGFLAQIKREFEGNSLLKAAFPDVLYENPEREAPSWSLDGGIIVKRSTNPKEATVEAHGLVDGQPTSKHFRMLIYDDVVTRESVSTPEQIAKTTEAWELSDNLGTVGGRRWYVGTRYSYADTYDAMMKRGSVKPRLYAATENGQIDGKPVLLSQEEWDRRVRDQGEATVSCQMLQNPLAGHQRMFNVEDLQVYEVRPEVLNVYILIDPARSKKKDSANTAMAVVGVDKAMNKFLLDGYNHKMDLSERWSHMKNLYTRWLRQPGVQGVRVGYEKFGAQADLDYFQERMKVEGPTFEVIELGWPSDGDGSKVDRVQRLGPDFRNHKFYLPYPTTKKTITSRQRRILDEGRDELVSVAIRRKDENGNIYDLSDQFKLQAHYFPYGGLKDLVDAVSRIYDCDPKPPVFVDMSNLEPEFT